MWAGHVMLSPRIFTRCYGPDIEPTKQEYLHFHWYGGLSNQIGRDFRALLTLFFALHRMEIQQRTIAKVKNKVKHPKVKYESIVQNRGYKRASTIHPGQPATATRVPNSSLVFAFPPAPGRIPQKE